MPTPSRTPKAKFQAAAEAYRSANPQSTLRFIATNAGLPSGSKPDPKKCSSGKHDLKEITWVTEPSARGCNICSKDCEDTHLACGECNDDVCNACEAAGRAFTRDDIMMWYRLSNDINAAATAKGAIFVAKFNRFKHKSATTEILDGLAAFFAQPL